MRRITLLLLAAGLATPLASQVPADTAPPIPLDRIIELIATRYRIPIPADSLYRLALRSAVQTLDPYSRYYSPSELKTFHERLEGSIGGIGAVVAFDSGSGTYRIEGVYLDSPALAAGLQGNDTIVALNGSPTTGQSMDQVIDRIKGTPGTVLHLTVRRARQSRPLEVAITRATIELPTVNGTCRQSGSWQHLIDPAHRIGYIEITGITRSAPAELAAALARVVQARATSLILDLRDNPGGLMESAIRMADMFLDSGIIVTTEDRGAPDSVARAQPGVAIAGPLVILVNENTASAAEVFTAALQDNHRATVVGARTFGKGLYQQLYDLPDSGAMRLSPGWYVRPSGKPIERHAFGADSTKGGVWPDSGMTVVVSAAESAQWEASMWDRDRLANTVGSGICPAGPPDDPILRRALEYLRAAPAPR